MKNSLMSMWNKIMLRKKVRHRVHQRPLEEQGQPRAFTPPLGTQLPRRPLLRALCILFLRH